MIYRYTLTKFCFMVVCRYAKWRAAHLHNCLNSGEKPSEPAPKPDDDQTLNDSENLEYGISSDSSKHPVSKLLVTHYTKKLVFKYCNFLGTRPIPHARCDTFHKFPTKSSDTFHKFPTKSSDTAVGSELCSRK